MFTAKLTTIGLLTTTLMLYVFINELKDLHGKCIIGFLSSLIVACAVNIFSRLESIRSFSNSENTQMSDIYFIITNVALLFALLWINVMIFDVWWVLR